MGEELTPELEHVAALVDEKPPEVRQAFQFCLAVAMEEEGAARLVNTTQVDGRTWYSYETVAGEVFSVVRPEIGVEEERVRGSLAGLEREMVGERIQILRIGENQGLNTAFVLLHFGTMCGTIGESYIDTYIP